MTCPGVNKAFPKQGLLERATDKGVQLYSSICLRGQVLEIRNTGRPKKMRIMAERTFEQHLLVT